MPETSTVDPTVDSGKTIVIINRGQRTYHVSGGRSLPPGGSVELLENEAKSLLGYQDLVDAKKAAPALGQAMDELQAENARLKAEIENLKADFAQATTIKTSGKKDK